MNILLVNDDGVYSSGILTLAKKLSVNHNVTVVAPQNQMSGTGHSMTLYGYVNFSKINILDCIDCYIVSGTPADCIKVAVNLILPEKPDLIISGVNKGFNLGTDIVYSGTVNSALEGAVHGIKAIAVSQEYGLKDFEFSTDFIVKNFDEFYSFLPKDAQTILNINIPSDDLNVLKGVKFAKIGRKIFKENYAFEENLGYRAHCRTTLADNTTQDDDVWLYDNGYITISPVKNDWNDEIFYNKLKGEKIEL